MSTTLAPSTPAAPRARGSHAARRVAGAVAVAVVANAVVSTATDQLFHELGVFPPWGQPMPDAGDNALALGYRTVFAVLGGYLAAALAARFAGREAAGAPMRAALAFGAVGLVLSALGAAVTLTQFDWGPAWYPLLLVAVALPAAGLGGALHRRRRTA